MTSSPHPSDKETVEQRHERRRREAQRETMTAALRSTIAWAPVGAVLCVVTLWALKDALISGQELLAGESDTFSEPFMPLTLLVGVGACCAAFITWRVTQSSGAVGGAVTLACAGCVVAIGLLCAVFSLILFDKGVPNLAWVSIAIMTGLGIAAVWIVSYVSG